jgi:hypothetical protein
MNARAGRTLRAGSRPRHTAAHEAPGFLLEGDEGGEGGARRQPVGIAGEHSVGHQRRTQATHLRTEPTPEEAPERFVSGLGGRAHPWLAEKAELPASGDESRGECTRSREFEQRVPVEHVPATCRLLSRHDGGAGRFEDRGQVRVGEQERSGGGFEEVAILPDCRGHSSGCRAGFEHQRPAATSGDLGRDE